MKLVIDMKEALLLLANRQRRMPGSEEHRVVERHKSAPDNCMQGRNMCMKGSCTQGSCMYKVGTDRNHYIHS